MCIKGRFLIIVFILLGFYGCDDSEEITSFTNCINQINSGHQPSTANCRAREVEICSAVSQEPSFISKAKLAKATIRAISSDLLSLVGIEFAPWGYSDCIAINKDTCRTIVAPYNPCNFEACMAAIPERCAKLK